MIALTDQTKGWGPNSDEKGEKKGQNQLEGERTKNQ